MLICPPFQHLRISSISTSGLATYLRENGVDCEEAYFHFEFMRICGKEQYSTAIERHRGSTAELIFAEALHGRVDPEWEEKLTTTFGDRERRRKILNRFERRCLQRILADGPDIIGLTTSYNQLMGSLWLARIVKREIKATVVLGGTPCADEMGLRLLEGYPEIDLVVSGHGEEPLLKLSRGVLPDRGQIQCHTPLDLDELPLPDYRPYLSEAEEFGQPPDISLLYQSSRGCWWGEKKHCTFCGLNRDQMSYSARSSSQVVSDIRTLWERHGCNVNATDCVLSREHLNDALLELASFTEKPWLFYELKANMTEAQVQTLVDAGVVAQVGIESLSTSLLKLMRKGASAIRTLAMMKWCRERGARIIWNMLYAIPGEEEANYREQIALIDKIPHLKPPLNVNPIRIDRYSPYYDHYRDHGWSDLDPADEYVQAHPHFNSDQLREVAYHFSGVGGVSPEAYRADLMQAFETWKARHDAGDGLFLDPRLGLVRNEGGLAKKISLDDLTGRIIGCTHRVTPISRVIRETDCARETLEEMVEEGLLYMENHSLLNLAVRTRLPDIP